MDSMHRNKSKEIVLDLMKTKVLHQTFYSGHIWQVKISAQEK